MTVYNKLCLAAIIAALFAGSPCHSQEVSFGSLKLDYEGRLVMALQPLKDLDELYAGNLEKCRVEAVQSGNLQQVLAAKAEIEGFREGSAPEIPETFPELRRYQGIYRAERAKRLAAVAETMKPLHAAYHRQLVELQTQLTRQEKLDEAVEVGKAIAEIEERIASGEVAGLNLVAAAGVPASAPSAPFAKDQKDATTNSLGMKFVPVPGTKVLFCIHETRRKDYAAYAAENPGANANWKALGSDGYEIPEPTEDHPVWRIDWESAKAFCEWLSKKEGKACRLPTDEEWSIAVGLKERRSRKDSPEGLNEKVKGEYPWGSEWPPPAGAGNYSDQSRKAKALRESESYLESYNDGFPLTAPVMSFAPNEFGIYDLGGNVMEWMEDWHNDKQELRVLRGSSMMSSKKQSMLSSIRLGRSSTNTYSGNGFRIVMEP